VNGIAVPPQGKELNHLDIISICNIHFVFAFDFPSSNVSAQVRFSNLWNEYSLPFQQRQPITFILIITLFNLTNSFSIHILQESCRFKIEKFSINNDDTTTKNMRSPSGKEQSYQNVGNENLDNMINIPISHKILKEKSEIELKNVDCFQRNHPSHSTNNLQMEFSSTNINQPEISLLPEKNLQIVPFMDLSNPTSSSYSLDSDQQQSSQQLSRIEEDPKYLSNCPRIERKQLELVSEAPTNCLGTIELSSFQSDQRSKELDTDFDIDDNLEQNEIQFSYDHIVCDSEEETDSNIDPSTF
jgi:hypothetical protein